MAINMTKTQVSSHTPTVVVNEAIGALVGNLKLAQVVDRHWENKAAGVGETIQIPKRAALTVNDKVADTEVSFQSSADSSVSIVLNKHKEVSQLFEDVARAFANQDVMSGYAKDAAVAIAEQIEKDGFTEAYTGFTSNSDLGTGNVDPTSALLLEARQVLTDAKAPAGSPKYAFLSTKAFRVMLGLDNWSRADALGDNGARIRTPGQILQQFDLWVIESQYVQKVSTTTHNIALTPEALALAMRPLPTPPDGMGVMSAVGGGEIDTPAQGLGLRVQFIYNGPALGTQVTTDALYGWKAVRPELGIDVLT